jgi:hypothetical protein
MEAAAAGLDGRAVQAEPMKPMLKAPMDSALEAKKTYNIR